MMNRLSLIALLAGSAFMATSANATVVNFDDLLTPGVLLSGVGGLSGTGNDLVSNGLLFKNSINYGPGNVGGLLVWSVIGGGAGNNADPLGGATLSHNFSGMTTTVTKADGGKFDFTSIDLSDLYNGPVGGQVDFMFTDDIGSTSQSVNLDSLAGLQTFAFNRSGLLSFAITPISTRLQSIQFDNVTYNSATGAVPEPATWAMMIMGFGLVGASMRRRQRVRFNYA